MRGCVVPEGLLRESLSITCRQEKRETVNWRREMKFILWVLGCTQKGEWKPNIVVGREALDTPVHLTRRIFKRAEQLTARNPDSQHVNASGGRARVPDGRSVACGLWLGTGTRSDCQLCERRDREAGAIDSRVGTETVRENSQSACPRAKRARDRQQRP